MDEIYDDVTKELDETIKNEDAKTTVLPTETMDDFKDELNNSLKKIYEGDILKGTVIGVSDTEVIVDLGYYAEGIIKLEELSNDPRFSIRQDIAVGDIVSGVVLRKDDGEGNISLSKKRADDLLAWDVLNEMMQEKRQVKVKISQVVNGGVTTYLNGIRGFIPASLLSLNYVENLDEWLNKEVTVVVVTVEEKAKKLILSGKELEKEKALQDKNKRIAQVETGVVVTGIVDKIAPYGAFLKLPNNLSGLLHISQISPRRIKSPNEVIKLGDELNVKIIEVKDGKISLSLKAVTEDAEVTNDIEEAPFEFSTGEAASTSLLGLLSNIKL